MKNINNLLAVAGVPAINFKALIIPAALIITSILIFSKTQF